MYKNIKTIYEKELSNFNLSPLDPQYIFLNHFLPNEREINILDAGCGSGKYIDNLYKSGYLNSYAVDLFKELKLEHEFYYKKESIDKMTFNNDFFDFIYSFSVIYYLKDIAQGIKELHRILKKNGILMISAHTKYSFFTLERVLKGKKLKHLEGVKFYSANYYKKLLEENGFEIVHMDGFNTSYFLYPWYRKFANRFKLNLPKIPSTVTKNHFLSLVRSELSYHSVIVAKKK